MSFHVCLKGMVGIMKPFDQKLEYFLVLMEELNISRAAEKIGINQGALSRSLSKLEADLNNRLFDRGGKGLRPTEYALSFKRAIEETLNTWEQHQTKHGLEVGGFHTNLSFGTSVPYVSRIFAQSVTNFLEDYPRINFNWEAKTSSDLTLDINEGRLDLALVFRPKAFSNLVIKKLFPVKAYCYKKKGEKEISYVFHDNRTVLNQKVMGRLKEKRIVEVQDYDLIESLILKSKNAGGVLPNLIGDKNSKLQKIGPSIISADLSLIYRYDNVKAKLISDFVSRLSKNKP